MAPDMSSDNKQRRVKFWYIKQGDKAIYDRKFWDRLEAELAAQELARRFGCEVFLLEAIMSVTYVPPQPLPLKYIWQTTRQSGDKY